MCLTDLETLTGPDNRFSHYNYIPMLYSAIFRGCKKDNFQMKNYDNFLIFAQNIDRGYTLEPPQRGGSNEYPQSMFFSKNKKIKYIPVHTSFTIQKWGVRGYKSHGHVILMSQKVLLKFLTYL